METKRNWTCSSRFYPFTTMAWWWCCISDQLQDLTAYKLPKKVRRLAIKSALSAKALEENILVLESLSFEAPKTKEFVAVLSNLSVDTKTLVVTDVLDEKVALSARNIPGVTVVAADGLNVLDVVSHNKLILTKSAVEKVEEVLA